MPDWRGHQDGLSTAGLFACHENSADELEGSNKAIMFIWGSSSSMAYCTIITVPLSPNHIRASSHTLYQLAPTLRS